MGSLVSRFVFNKSMNHFCTVLTGFCTCFLVMFVGLTVKLSLVCRNNLLYSNSIITVTTLLQSERDRGLNIKFIQQNVQLLHKLFYSSNIENLLYFHSL